MRTTQRIPLPSVEPVTRLMSWLNTVWRSETVPESPFVVVLKDRFLAYNVTRNRLLASRVEWSGTSSTRRRGLLGREGLEPNEGMYIVPTQWIHMFGMRFPVDVVFISAEGRVLHLHHSLQPNRFSRVVWNAEGALELPAGTLRATDTVVGDIVEVR